ncbi:hypothetical protein [Streptomyces spinosirectus]
MLKRDPEQAAQRQAQQDEQRREREEWAARQKAENDALTSWRTAHPAEKALNAACMLRPWPGSKFGETPRGPILGGHAEFIDAGAHKASTATRPVGGVATDGASHVAGLKDKGSAVINVTFGNGAVHTYNVTPENTTLRMASQYVTAFNALATQLADEAAQR